MRAGYALKVFMKKKSRISGAFLLSNKIQRYVLGFYLYLAKFIFSSVQTNKLGLWAMSCIKSSTSGQAGYYVLIKTDALQFGQLGQ